MFINNQQPQPDYQCKIKKIILIPTQENAYRDVMQRSFTLNANASELSKLESMFAVNNVGLNCTITESEISKTAPSLVSLSSVPIGRAEIANGWGTSRFRFLLIAESAGIGGWEESYIQGYTEYADRSLSGAIDPNLVFYINSITRVDKMVDPGTNMVRTRVRSTFNVITNKFGGTRYEEVESSTDFKLIRPVDIVTGIKNLELYDSADFLLDTSKKIDSQPQTSNRGNSNGLKYVTNTLNKFIEARSMCDIGCGDRKDILKEAANNLSEFTLFSIPLLFGIHHVTGEFNPSNFTLNILHHIDPNVYNVIFDPSFGNNNYIMQSKLGQPNFLTTLDSSEMLNPKLETLIALKTANTINSLMSDNLISVLGLMITNVNGFPEVIPGAAESFIDSIADQDKIMAVNRIIAKVKETLIPDITNLNSIILEISFYSDMLGDTVLGIKLSTGYFLAQAETIYRLPTFADSLFSPMVSNTAMKKVLQEDFSNLTELTYTTI